MIKQNEVMKNFLPFFFKARRLCLKKLVFVSNETEISKSEIMDIMFILNDRHESPVSVSGYKDGESLSFSNKIFNSYSMGELGRVELVPVLEKSDAKITKINLFVSNESVACFEIFFNDGTNLSIFNWGDDLRIENTGLYESLLKLDTNLNITDLAAVECTFCNQSIITNKIKL